MKKILFLCVFAFVMWGCSDSGSEPDSTLQYDGSMNMDTVAPGTGSNANGTYRANDRDQIDSAGGTHTNSGSQTGSNNNQSNRNTSSGTGRTGQGRDSLP